MNYFELFDIPVQLKLDKTGLHSKYIALSRQYHPDYFAGAGDAKLAEVMDISATLNKAFKTFQEPDATISYVLQLKGLLEEEEKYQLPASFLLEVMEINEQLMDLEAGDPAAATLQAEIHRLQTDIHQPVKRTIENYVDGVTSREELLAVKDYYYKKKYLDRISRELARKL